MFWRKLNKKKNRFKFTSHIHVREAFHGRIGVLIEMYKESAASKNSLQKCIDREIKKLKMVCDEVPDNIKDLLNKNDLKY